eukprot:TRINITY_DN2001_c0_g1_i1.p1 TRINITY_DN2001_c0_g1~~TRINITY_DN2001_c0_g1_i1.p1  ORF type:complete len:767 (-),score=187.82 TRINITY_DN2001_c0_g1_i1:56-2356(-)
MPSPRKKPQAFFRNDISQISTALKRPKSTKRLPKQRLSIDTKQHAVKKPFVVITKRKNNDLEHIKDTVNQMKGNSFYVHSIKALQKTMEESNDKTETPDTPAFMAADDSVIDDFIERELDEVYLPAQTQRKQNESNENESNAIENATNDADDIPTGHGRRRGIDIVEKQEIFRGNVRNPRVINEMEKKEAQWNESFEDEFIKFRRSRKRRVGASEDSLMLAFLLTPSFRDICRICDFNGKLLWRTGKTKRKQQQQPIEGVLVSKTKESINYSPPLDGSTPLEVPTPVETKAVPSLNSQQRREIQKSWLGKSDAPLVDHLTRRRRSSLIGLMPFQAKVAKGIFHSGKMSPVNSQPSTASLSETSLSGIPNPLTSQEVNIATNELAEAIWESQDYMATQWTEARRVFLKEKQTRCRKKATGAVEKSDKKNHMLVRQKSFKRALRKTRRVLRKPQNSSNNPSRRSSIDDDAIKNGYISFADMEKRRENDKEIEIFKNTTNTTNTNEDKLSSTLPLPNGLVGLSENLKIPNLSKTLNPINKLSLSKDIPDINDSSARNSPDVNYPDTPSTVGSSSSTLTKRSTRLSNNNPKKKRNSKGLRLVTSNINSSSTKLHKQHLINQPMSPHLKGYSKPVLDTKKLVPKSERKLNSLLGRYQQFHNHCNVARSFETTTNYTNQVKSKGGGKYGKVSKQDKGMGIVKAVIQFQRLVRGHAARKYCWALKQVFSAIDHMFQGGAIPFEVMLNGLERIQVFNDLLYNKNQVQQDFNGEG